MEGLDADGLALVLQGHLPDKAISLLADQAIDGSSFMDLDVKTLKAFEVPMGFTVLITKLIAAIKSGTKVLDFSQASGAIGSDSVLTSSNVSHGNHESRIFMDLEEDKESPEKDKESPEKDKESPENDNESPDRDKESPDNHTESPDNNAEPEDKDTDGILSEFLTNECIKGLSRYLKVGLVGRIERWKGMQQMGLPHPSMPNLGIEKRFLKNYTQPSKRKSKTSKTPTKPTRTSSRIRKGAKTVENTGDDGSSEYVQPNDDDDDDDDDYDVDDDDEDEDGDGNDNSNANNSRVASYNAPPSLKTQEELRAISPSLPNFEIEKVLLEDSRTKKFVPTLQEGKLLGTKERKAMFRILGRYLCFNYQDDPSKVNASMREGLAKCIVVTYPQLQKTIDVPGKTPWSHIWSKSGGHLNNIIKRIQTGLPEDKRVKKGKVAKRKKAAKITPSNVNIKQLALLMPDKPNKLEIGESMAKTFTQRCQARDNGASITEIIKDFPHLCSYDGEMLAAEYKRMCPNSRDMCPEMEEYIPKILEKWNDEDLVLNLKDETFRAFFILASKLPHAISRNSCVIPKEEEVVVIVTPGIDLKEFVLERRLQAKRAVQPYVVALKGLITKEILKYFVVLDGELLEFGRIPFTRCIDWLFKSYVVFNVAYPKSWALFFRFLQTCMYKVYFSENDDIPPAVMEKYNEMKAL